jgi:hypothetical protein
MKRTPASQQTQPQTEIVIERREVIGTIELDPYGTENPIRAAFQLMGGYVAENVDHRQMMIQFTFEGRTFHFGVGAEKEDAES